MPEDFSAYVSFPYNEDILHTIQSLDKRSWIKGTKEWEIRIKDISVLLSKFSYLAFNIYGRYVDLSPKKFDLTAYHFKTNCYKHQLEGFEYGMNHDRWLLGDDQGLGKSKQAIDIAVARKQLQGFKHCLIICGVNSLKWNWRNEIKTHSNENSHILGQKIKKNGQITIGSNKDKLNDIVNLDSISAYFLITNIETLRNDEINDEIIHQIDDGNIPMIVVDEMHKCFDYNTPILTDSGYMAIGDIVKNKLNINVYSYNVYTNSIEIKHVTNWFENNISENLIKLKFETSEGIKEIKCTATHKFYTSNRGWVKAKDITEEDNVVEYGNETIL